MKSFIKEFKDFALRGNVLNLAVGLIIGSAFQGVVSSLTTNILSPLIGLFAGANFDSLKLEFLGISLNYGAFITTVINFIIMAFTVFLIVKLMNKIASNNDEKEKPTVKKCPFCFSDVNIAATRCPACTSEIKTEKEKKS